MATPAQTVVRIEELTKTYGALAAVDSLNLSIYRGEIFGFLGPNGAGKTTTLRMLMGILAPSSGRITVEGLDSRRDRVEIMRRTGYVPDQPMFQDFLRGREILEFVGRMHGQSRAQARTNAARLLEELALTEAAEEFAVNYSMGMRKKLGLASALMHDPALLILDEPTNGLDPLGTRELLDRLESSVAAGKTIFLSTHLLDMAERICSRVGIIHRGRLVGSGNLEEVMRRSGEMASLEEAFLALTAVDSSQAA